MEINELEHGVEIRANRWLAYFGKKESSIENCRVTYPNLGFKSLSQTHSDIVIESAVDDYTGDADAHFTSILHRGLVLRTADCAPIMLVDDKRGYVAAVHAGWRGVCNQILVKTLEALYERGSEVEQVKILIGPHIQRESFEVDEDVYQQLKLALPNRFADEWPSLVDFDNERKKYKVDLHRHLILQMNHYGILDENIHSLYYDTFKDERWHSHRRDREKAGRNISFISLL